MKTVVLVGSGVVSIPPKFGGAIEMIIYEIARFLPKNKFNVFVLDGKEKHNKKTENINGVLYNRSFVPKFGNIFLLRLSETLFGLLSIKKINKINSVKKVDIIHAHTVFTGLPLTLLKSFLPKSSKLIYTSHNPAWTVERKNMDVFNRIILKMEGYIIKNSDFVTTVSDTMRENIIKETKINKAKIKRIYNFVDLKKFSPNKKGFKEKLGITGPMVLFVGKLIPNKGVEYLIRSAAIVKRDVPNVKYVLVGPMSFEYQGENKWINLVKKLGLEDTIIFTGALSDEELPYAYASADVFCFPTLKESFGIVLIEAMASGLPIITSKLDTLMEVVKDASILVDPYNVHNISDKVSDLLKSKKIRTKLIKSSLLNSRKFNTKKTINEYSKLYNLI